MKLILGIFLIFTVGSVISQDDLHESTEQLLAAQRDLTLGHRFFETAIFLNRAQISAYLYRINREIINSHINTYSFIKNLGLDTLAELDGLQTDADSEQCVNNIRSRWEMQVTR
jgi:hypothetical protein